MKIIGRITAFFIISMFVLSGCSAHEANETDAALSKGSLAAEERSDAQAEDTEVRESSFMHDEDLPKTETSTTTDETEPIVLKVCSLKAGYIGLQNGWADQILLDKFNIKLDYVDYNTYGWQVDLICEEEPDIDIIVWPALFLYEEYADHDLSLEWDDELLSYAPYLKSYLGKYINCVTELSGGKRCGIISDSTLYEEQDKETVWTIGKGSAHPEAAMTLLNWLASSEGMLTISYGPQGICWDIDQDGYYYLTEMGLELQNGGEVTFPEEYGGYTRELHSGALGMGQMFRKSAVSPDSPHGETYDWTTWHLMQNQIEEK